MKYLIAGLGNPGERYRGTRHNLGFRVVDELAGRLGAGPPRLECNALVAAAGGVTLVRPQTYMNRSGHAARCLLERRGFEPGDLMVVYDDVNLPLGRLRMRPKGSPGGHRGMESVVHSLRPARTWWSSCWSPSRRTRGRRPNARWSARRTPSRRGSGEASRRR